MERSVHGTIRIQPGDVIQGAAVDSGEKAADENLAVQLQSDRTDGAIRTSAGIKSRVNRAVRVQSGDVVHVGVAIDGGEIAADDNLAVRLDRHGIDRGVGTQAGIESRVQSAVAVEAGNAVDRRAANRRKSAADINLGLSGSVICR